MGVEKGEESMSCRLTGTHMGSFVQKVSRKRKDSQNEEEEVIFYEQEAIPELELFRKLKFLQLLGGGGFGILYLCEYSGLQYAVKIPKILLKRRSYFISLGDTLAVNRERLNDENLYMECLNEFRREFAIAEMARDTPTMRKHYLDRREVGHHVIRMSHAEFLKHKAEEAEMERHPGFENVLKVVHFSPSIPIIICEACNASTHDLFYNGFFSNQRKLERLKKFASDVIHGMDYLKDVMGMAQVDLKLGNILVKIFGPTITYVICDYGGCMYAEAPLSEAPSETPGFRPPIPEPLVRLPSLGSPVPQPEPVSCSYWNPSTDTCYEASIYALAAMLMFVYGSWPEIQAALFNLKIDYIKEEKEMYMWMDELCKGRSWAEVDSRLQGSPQVKYCVDILHQESRNAIGLFELLRREFNILRTPFARRHDEEHEGILMRRWLSD